MFDWKWMTKEDALTIANWEYEKPYDFYNMNEDSEDLDEFLNPFNWKHMCTAYMDGRLAGFAVFKRSDETNEVEVSLGLRPDLTGKGFGTAFVEATMDKAFENGHVDVLVINVAAFNERAISVYERTGFRKTAAYLQKTNQSSYPFVEMKKVSKMEISK
ncbi:GNAT family N-acetyltransferase [Bacillus sp. H-16]|uniref:GNAT family N-acetyltransferase n=1 Tax=Alteribacter salitolerans TaxID=2912333 RepID=UPI001964914D|nr:GNAT family N-acetyltransferase [Alteribacter salitolerans]MBM7097425.1 GNAT family N-acetyltransferase [Alteribacter salitolerans]